MKVYENVVRITSSLLSLKVFFFDIPDIHFNIELTLIRRPPALKRLVDTSTMGTNCHNKDKSRPIKRYNNFEMKNFKQRSFYIF